MVWLASEMKLDLLSSSVIVAVAVPLAPIVTILPGAAVSMAVNVSEFSTVSSFTTDTLTICSVTPGAKVTTVLACPMKSAGSEEILSSGVTAT